MALAITVVYASVVTWRRANRPGGRWVGITECAWRGPPRVTIRPGLRKVDSIAVAAHESVHAAQCIALGPLRYRWQTLFAASNLALEAPAYCAGARVRVRFTRDTVTERTIVPGDMLAAMGDAVDSATIRRALVSSCPEFVKSP